MKNLSPEICRQIGKARRDMGLSQTALARELGCKQPALSMFEAGDGTKLSDEAVQKLAERFGISLEPVPDVAEAGSIALGSGPGSSSSGRLSAFCPNCHCPSNVPYLVEGRLFLSPLLNGASPVDGARRCAFCGEVLEIRCPSCGGHLNTGACCCLCGAPYVTPTLSPDVDVVQWVRQRRADIELLQHS